MDARDLIRGTKAGRLIMRVRFVENESADLDLCVTAIGLHRNWRVTCSMMSMLTMDSITLLSKLPRYPVS